MTYMHCVLINVCVSLLVLFHSCLWFPGDFPTALIKNKNKIKCPPISKVGKILPEKQWITMILVLTGRILVYNQMHGGCLVGNWKSRELVHSKWGGNRNLHKSCMGRNETTASRYVKTSPGMTLTRLMHGDIVHEKWSTVVDFDFHLLLCWSCDTNSDICDGYAKSALMNNWWILIIPWSIYNSNIVIWAWLITH